MLLGSRVVGQRAKNEKFVGDKLDNVPAGEQDPLNVAARCHANFAENVPLALLLAAIVELNGGNRRILNGSLAALLVLRVAHVELGLRGPKSTSFGRALGFAGTMGFIGGWLDMPPTWSRATGVSDLSLTNFEPRERI